MNEPLTLIVAVLACFIAFLAWRSQQKHNWLSVRPLASVTYNDLNKKVIVTLRNNGTGPLIIKTLRVKDADGMARNSLYSWIPQHLFNQHELWFVGEVDGRSIRPGGSLTLLRYRHPSHHLRDEMRRSLARLTVVVEFKDIYERKQLSYERSLRWFGREEPLKG